MLRRVTGAELASTVALTMAHVVAVGASRNAAHVQSSAIFAVTTWAPLAPVPDRQDRRFDTFWSRWRRGHRSGRRTPVCWTARSRNQAFTVPIPDLSSVCRAENTVRGTALRGRRGQVRLPA